MNKIADSTYILISLIIITVRETLAMALYVTHTDIFDFRDDYREARRELGGAREH